MFVQHCLIAPLFTLVINYDFIYYDANVKRNLIVKVYVFNLQWNAFFQFNATFFLQS